ncbi:benzoate transport [Sphingomonas sp. BE270]|jgi:benzoate transport|uniref:MFS transporter n=1 Tax=Sphingomonas sp. BE270 TaxID=2817726 RepID=UPI002859DED9|nr:MFS transporter [Sphingomonas sp. BE270]MDR7260050.1 benzoate transport [Sphingomonas sp. BE270]
MSAESVHSSAILFETGQVENLSGTAPTGPDNVVRSQWIDDAQRRWSALRVLVVALCFLLNALDGMDIVIMSYIAPVLSDDWALSPESLGVIFSASLAGMVLGCLFVAPLADRYGRRPTILWMLALITMCMMASGLATSLAQLVAARFVIGIGIGAILASMAALAAEFAPPHQRTLAVAVVNAGYPLGAVLTGLISVVLLPLHGWQAMLIGSSLLSLVALILASIFLPESLEFLLRRQPRQALRRANAVLDRLGEKRIRTLPTITEDHVDHSWRAVFARGRAASTVCLWIGVFMAFMTLYFAISWITKLATQAGLPLGSAIYVGTIFNLGAFFGTVAMGRIAQSLGLQRVAPVFLVLAAVLLVVFGAVSMPLTWVLATSFALGMAVYGGFNAFYALAAELYPAAIRGTGIGWAMGIGRFGAAGGPLLGGMMIGQGATLSVIMGVFAVPLLVAAVMASMVRRR